MSNRLGIPTANQKVAYTTVLDPGQERASRAIGPGDEETIWRDGLWSGWPYPGTPG